MLNPNQFEVNDAWIAFRVNDEFLVVKEDPFDVFVLLDAASAYVLGFVFSKVVEETPTEKDVEDLFNNAWAIKQQWAKKLLVTDNSIASNVFIQEARKHGIPYKTVQLNDLSQVIGPLKRSFVKDFLGGRK